MRVERLQTSWAATRRLLTTKAHATIRHASEWREGADRSGGIMQSTSRGGADLCTQRDVRRDLRGPASSWGHTINYPFAVLVALYTGCFAYLYLRCRDHLAFQKYLSNHAFFLAPLNFLFTFFVAGRQCAVFETKSVPGLARIRDNYPIIRDEASAMFDAGVFQRPPSNDDAGFNTFEKGGYRTFRLKWYTKECSGPAVMHCPKTCALLDSIPAVRSALFTVLPPGGRIGRHHDPVASSLRYHLGLLTPNSDKCALTLDGVDYPWLDGEELLFDQTYLHSAVNHTATSRVILFCDVEKTQLRWPFKQLADGVNNVLVARVSGADDKGRLSWISSTYKPIYKVRSYVKEKIRPRSMLAYNIIKFGTLGALILLLYIILR
jgi:beta-hydroxylase